VILPRLSLAVLLGLVPLCGGDCVRRLAVVLALVVFGSCVFCVSAQVPLGWFTAKDTRIVNFAVDPDRVWVGSPVRISGNLEYKRDWPAGWEGDVGKTVSLLVNGVSVMQTQTVGDGYFMFVWTPLQEGRYEVVVSFAGREGTWRKPCASSRRTVTAVALTVPPGGDIPPTPPREVPRGLIVVGVVAGVLAVGYVVLKG